MWQASVSLMDPVDSDTIAGQVMTYARVRLMDAVVSIIAAGLGQQQKGSMRELHAKSPEVQF